MATVECVQKGQLATKVVTLDNGHVETIWEPGDLSDDECISLASLFYSRYQKWVCFWCGGDANITKNGDMHSEIYDDQPICQKCLDKHHWYLAIYGHGLRKDGRQSVFQPSLL